MNNKDSLKKLFCIFIFVMFFIPLIDVLFAYKESFKCTTTPNTDNTNPDISGRAYININGKDRPDAMCQILGDEDECDGFYRTDTKGINYNCIDAPTS